MKVILSASFELVSSKVPWGDSYIYLIRLDGGSLAEETTSVVWVSGYEHIVAIDYLFRSMAVCGSSLEWSVD